jgi:hypothetical protein
MDKYCVYNILILSFLFIGNALINTNHYFLLIYLILFLYHSYIFYLILKNEWEQKFNIIKFTIFSIFLYAFTYFIICDPNPLLFIFSYYIFFPNFFKAILIIFFHTYFLSKYLNDKNYNLINSTELSSDIIKKYFIKKKMNINFIFFHISLNIHLKVKRLPFLFY